MDTSVTKVCLTLSVFGVGPTTGGETPEVVYLRLTCRGHLSSTAMAPLERALQLSGIQFFPSFLILHRFPDIAAEMTIK